MALIFLVPYPCYQCYPWSKEEKKSTHSISQEGQATWMGMTYFFDGSVIW
jgi:hypothetical protein